MRRFLQILLVVCILALGGTLFWWYQSSNDVPKEDIVGFYHYYGSSKGFFVTTGEDGDYPSKPGLTIEEQKAELDAVVAFAKENGFNAVFYEAIAEQTAWYRSKRHPVHSDITAEDNLLSHFDPLAYLCKQAAAARVQVFAVADADADTVLELTKGYALAGVLMDMAGGHGPKKDEIRPLVEQVRSAMSQKYSSVALGLLFDGSGNGTVTPELIKELTAGDTIQLAVPMMRSSVDDKENGYAVQLERWIDAVQGSARLYTGNAVCAVVQNSDLEYEDANEISYQLFINSLHSSVAGAVLQNYSQLAANQEEAQMLVSFMNSNSNPLPDLTLTIPKKLAVTYPSKDITTTDSAIFLMGTSDPDLPLTINGKEVERISKGGSFGVKVDLAIGSNTFTFRQGEISDKVTIVRNRAGGGTGLISGITKGSIFPKYDLGVDSNETIELSCMGPAGGTVTASVGGMTVTLKQAVAASQNGVAAIYKGSITLNPANYPADETKSIGKVTYTLTYGGKTTTYQSEGRVMVAGKNTQLGMEVTEYLASVLSNKDNDDTIVGTLKVGAKTRIKGRAATTRGGSPTIAYQLENGGWILADKVRILEGSQSPDSVLSEVTMEQDDKSQTLVFHGGTPAVISRRSDNELQLEFYGATVSADVSAIATSFTTAIETQQITGGVKLTLKLTRSSDLWGYDVTYDTENNRTLVYLRHPPTRSVTPGKPLEGVTILLDPGHGGSDPGALGVAGETGPAESEINLAAAWAVKYRLEQLGASVSMTRVDDDTRSYLNDRCILSQQQRPDIFLSIHHNSTVLTKDVNTVRRMEVYYHEAIAKPLADSLMARLPGMLGRDDSEPEESYYYVTRMTYAPSVLFELGYIVNPREYEESCDSLNLYKTACGIAQAVLDVIPQPKPVEVSSEQSLPKA